MEIWNNKETFSGSEIGCETNLGGVKLYETSKTDILSVSLPLFGPESLQLCLGGGYEGHH
jgi:hypothetical protein